MRHASKETASGKHVELSYFQHKKRLRSQTLNIEQTTVAIEFSQYKDNRTNNTQ